MSQLKYVPLIFVENGESYDWSKSHSISTNTDHPVVVYHHLYERALIPSKSSGQVSLSVAHLVTTNKKQEILKRKTIPMQASRLWLLVNVGEPPLDENGRHYTCDHINKNHYDNRPENLRWLSVKDQMFNQKKKEISLHWEVYTDFDLLNVFKPFLDSKKLFNMNGDCIKKFADGSYKMMRGKAPHRTSYVVVNHKGRGYAIHRIVAYLFGDSKGVFLQDIYDKKLVVDHIDHNKQNNASSNLIVCTMKENSQATHDRGFGNLTQREIVSYAYDVKTKTASNTILNRYQGQKSASETLGIARQQIHRVLAGRNNSVHGLLFKYADEVDEQKDESVIRPYKKFKVLNSN